MTSSAPKVAVIGLGSMGFGMATSLRRAGFEVTGCDVAEEAVARFVKDGGKGAKSPGTTPARRTMVTSAPTPATAQPAPSTALPPAFGNIPIPDFEKLAIHLARAADEGQKALATALGRNCFLSIRRRLSRINDCMIV